MAEPTTSNYPTSLDSSTTLGGDVLNFKQFTLDAGINSLVTTISVAESIASVNFPCYGLVGSEIVYIESSGSGDFTSVVRGANGTTAASHISGDILYLVYSANLYNQLKRAIIAIETALGITGAFNFAPTASPTFTGTTTIASVQLTENGGIALDAALSADGKYSGIVESGTAGAALAVGDLCYLSVSDSRWELTDADASATAFGKLGMCVQAAAGDGSATTMLLWGKIRADAAFPTLTVGAPVFVGTVAGAIQTTAPSGSADIVRIVGYGNTTDELMFCPSTEYMELT